MNLYIKLEIKPLEKHAEKREILNKPIEFLKKFTEADCSLEKFIPEILEFSDNFLENLHEKDEIKDFTLEELTKLFFASLILLEFKYVLKMQILTKNPKISQIVFDHYSIKNRNASLEKQLNCLIINQNKSLNFLTEFLHYSSNKTSNTNSNNSNNIENNINSKNSTNNINNNFFFHANYQKKPISKFDKEDDLLVNFIFCAANLRAAIFRLKSESRFKIKDIAGKIIPAIASTNAIIAAIQASEALKLLLNYEKPDFLQLLRNPSFNKSKEIKSESSLDNRKNAKCAACAVETFFSTNLEVNLNLFTLGDLVDKLCAETLEIKKPVVICGKSVLYNCDDYDDEEEEEECSDFEASEISKNEKEEIKNNDNIEKNSSNKTANDNNNNNNVKSNFYNSKIYSKKKQKDFDKTLSELGVLDNAVLKIEEMENELADASEEENESNCDQNILRLIVNFNPKLEKDFVIGDLSFYFNSKEVIMSQKLLKKFEVKEEQRKPEVKIIDLNEEEGKENINQENCYENKFDKNNHEENFNFKNNNNNDKVVQEIEENQVSKLLGNKRHREEIEEN